jgi:hypothetical protein
VQDAVADAFNCELGEALNANAIVENRAATGGTPGRRRGGLGRPRRSGAQPGGKLFR